MDFDKQKEKHISNIEYLKEIFRVFSQEQNIYLIYFNKYIIQFILWIHKIDNKFDLYKYSRKPNCDFYDYLIWKHQLYDPIVQQIKEHYGI